jgi:hypothetical protein
VLKGLGTSGGNVEEAARFFGLIVEPDDLGAIEQESKTVLWPCHADAVALFRRCLTQLRVGPGGLIGFDYPAVELVMRWMNVRRHRRRRELFEQLRVMEDELLEWATE